MRLLDLFSGIGGFSYAAEKLVGGYETIGFCEQDTFCQQVLRKHWKDVPIYDDVRKLDASRLGRIDIVTGGFPCQAVSHAGLQRATEDDRWLWDEMLRIVQACKPRWVVGENVTGLVNINEGILFEQVQTDLEKEGYSVQSFIIGACSKNAPHIRNRVWIIGHYRGDEFLAHSKCNQRRDEIRRKSEQEEGIQIELWEKDSSTRKPSRASDIRKTSDEHVANSKSSKSRKQTQRQGGESIVRGNTDNGRHKGKRKEINTDVPYSQSMGWYERSKIRKTSKRKEEYSSDYISNSSSSSGETEDVSNTQCRSSEAQLQRQQSVLREQNSKRETTRSGNGDLSDRRSWSTECRMGNMDDGISQALSGHFSREPEDVPRVTRNQEDRAKKLKALGNSIVPQVAAEILYAIKVAEEGDKIE